MATYRQIDAHNGYYTNLSYFEVTYQLADIYGDQKVYEATGGQAGTNKQWSDFSLGQVALGAGIGAGLHFIPQIASGFKTMWTAQTTEHGLAARLVAPIAQTTQAAKQLLGSLADTTGLQILRKAGGKLTTPLGKVINIPKSQIQTSEDATKWLLNHADDMKTLLNPKSSLEEQAVMAINIRNDFVAAARNSIYDTRVTQQLNEKSALWIREEIFAQYNHLSGGAKYKKIIEDAFSVKDFNVNGKEYRGLGREAEYKGCFVAGTLVHTDKGLVPIEQIKVGDMVLSKHESGQGEQAYKRVISTFKSVEKMPIVRVSFWGSKGEDGRSGGAFLFCTDNHPFWSYQKKNWVLAGDIQDQRHQTEYMIDLSNNPIMIKDDTGYLLATSAGQSRYEFVYKCLQKSLKSIKEYAFG